MSLSSSSGIVWTCAWMSRFSTGGQAGAIVLLGPHRVKRGLQVRPHRRDGVLAAEERDGAFKVAAVGLQFGHGQRVQGVPGLSCGVSSP